MTTIHRAHTVILGGGPGGTGPLFAAIKNHRARELLDAGVHWLEPTGTFASGSIGDYKIASDTQADVLLECLPSDPSAPLGDMIGAGETKRVEEHRGGPLPLSLASAFLARAGRSARALVDAAPNSAIHAHRAVVVHVEDDGFRVVAGGVEIHARTLVSAMGGMSLRKEALEAPLLDGRTPGSLGARCVVTTDELFRNGVAAYAEHLPSARAPRVAILGGSHSAYATAVMIRERLGPDATIQILCRRLPKIFYPTLEAARTEGYTQPTDADVCPVTKRVYRLAGLRLRARDFVRGVWGLGDAPRQRNVAIVHLSEREPSFAGDALASADLTVLALGYRARTVPFFAKNDAIFGLRAHVRDKKPLVDGQCRLLGEDGTPVPRAFGIGLASGFVPHGTMGGEPSFDGQTNGFWLYQNDVGARIVDQILALR